MQGTTLDTTALSSNLAETWLSMRDTHRHLACSYRTSECELCPQPHVALCNPTATRIRRENFAECIVGDPSVGIPEIWVVSDVQCFGTELNLQTLPQGERSEDAKVEVPKAGTTQ